MNYGLYMIAVALAFCAGVLFMAIFIGGDRDDEIKEEENGNN